MERILGSDAARAVGRFLPDGPTGYRAATAPDAPLRKTRAEAVDDERAWLERDPLCVKAWPECENGKYDPRCCRFPKSCSC